METTYIRQYSPKWELVIEFPSKQEQAVLDDTRLLNLIRMVITDHPWKDTGGNSLNHSLVISSEYRSIRSSNTNISFEHQGLVLSHQKLWAYETWAESVANSVGNELAHILQVTGLDSGVIWRIRMALTSPSRQTYAEYRLASEPGDIVRMPCGTIAVVTDFDILMLGHVKELTLRPVCGIFRHFWLALRKKLNPQEEQINQLTKIGEAPLA